MRCRLSGLQLACGEIQYVMAACRMSYTYLRGSRGIQLDPALFDGVAQIGIPQSRLSE